MADYTEQLSESHEKKVGLMGGTFDPVHLGHLIMAESAYQAYGLSQVLFIPSGHSYFKDHRAMRVTEPEIRYEMVRLAVGGNPHFAISDMEIRREGNTYTYETLEQLHRENPDTDYYFVAGADTVLSMQTWREPERIFAGCTVLAAVRSDSVSAEQLTVQIERIRKEYHADIRMLPSPDVGISSTMLREAAARGESLRYLTTDAVREYITAQGLYRPL